MNYEELQIHYNNVPVVEMDLSQVDGLKGLYYNGRIAIKQNMPETEKACVLAEELGHHYTTVGNILDQSSVSNRKQELRARMWGYDKLIGLTGILKCYKRGCRNMSEMADFLEVTEEFLAEALKSYRKKYGESVTIGDYTICFEPCLAVLKMN